MAVVPSSSDRRSLITWQLSAGVNAVIGFACLAVAFLIVSGLVSSKELSVNRFALATGLVFTAFGVHYGAHSVQMLLPSIGIDDSNALALRESWHWPSIVVDVAGATAVLFYLSVRRSRGAVFGSAAPFEEMKARERHAVEINDNIVQGLSVAKYALDQGRDEQSRRAIEDSLKKARGIITELLGEEGSETGLGAGDLRRTRPATVRGGDAAV